MTFVFQPTQSTVTTGRSDAGTPAASRLLDSVLLLPAHPLLFCGLVEGSFCSRNSAKLRNIVRFDP
jgi:hypothetical protein